MLGHFNRYQCARHQINIRTAKSRRNIQSVQAHFLGFFDETCPIRWVQLVRVRVKIIFQRQNFIPYEAPHHGDDQFLFFCELQIHPAGLNWPSGMAVFAGGSS